MIYLHELFYFKVVNVDTKCMLYVLLVVFFLLKYHINEDFLFFPLILRQDSSFAT